MNSFNYSIRYLSIRFYSSKEVQHKKGVSLRRIVLYFLGTHQNFTIKIGTRSYMESVEK